VPKADKLPDSDNLIFWFQASAAMLMKSMVFWVITRRRVVIIYRRFFAGFLSYSESWPVKMGPTCCPETSVNNYHTTPCNYPEDHRFQFNISLRTKADCLTWLQVSRLWRHKHLDAGPPPVALVALHQTEFLTRYRSANRKMSSKCTSWQPLSFYKDL
jgi:hypothetical protein